MADITESDLAYINKNFAKKSLAAEDVFGFRAVAARADKVTSYNTRLDKVTLESFAKSMKNGAVAMGVLHQNQLPVGRVYNGKLDGNALNVNFYALRNMTIAGSSGGIFGGGSGATTTNDIERMIDAGTLNDVSVGFQADRNKYMCNIDKQPIMSPKCEHMPGQTYDNVKCVANIIDPTAILHEVSVVMAGALPGAEIQSMSFDSKEDWFTKTTTNNGEMAYATYSMTEEDSVRDVKLEDILSGYKMAGEITNEEDGMTKEEIMKLQGTIENQKTRITELEDESNELNTEMEGYAENLKSMTDELSTLKTRIAELDGMAKVGKHYDEFLNSEIMRLGVALEGNGFDKDLQKKQLIGLSVEDKTKIRDAYEGRMESMFKKGKLETEDKKPESKKRDDSHQYKV